MKRKIRITESELRNIILEAINSVVGDNPTNPPSTVPATTKPALKAVGTNYADTISLAVTDIENVKKGLSRFTSLPGDYFGIPNEKMQLFGEVFNHLDAAKEALANIMQ